MTLTVQLVETLRRLLADVQAGTVRVIDVRYATQTDAQPPHAPTGQETITIVVKREG